jgi:hypothetical protein
VAAVDGDEAATDRLEDEVLQRLKIAQITALSLELGVGGLEALREPARREGDHEKRPRVEEHAENLERRGLMRRLEERRQRENGATEYEADVEGARRARDGKAARAGQKHAGGRHGEHVQKREHRPRAAGGRDDGGDEHGVEDTDQPRDASRPREGIEEHERARGHDHREQGEAEDAAIGAGQEVRRQHLTEHQQQRGHPQPRP